jgi:hypothetical protein
VRAAEAERGVRGHAKAAPSLAMLLALVVPALTLLPVAVWRFLDGDEGDYATAASLVFNGRLLYHDFLYTQTPLLPYVYGAWAEVVGERWLAMRLLSVAFSLGVAVLLYRHVSARAGDRLGVAASALFGLSTLVFTWYPTFKTYALSTLLLFAAYVLIDRARPGPRVVAVAGGLAALSVQTRALLLGGAAVLAWAAWRSGGIRRLWAFTAGFGVLLLPTLVLFAADPHRFLFGNLWYHGQRSSSGLVGDVRQKGEVVASLLGVGTDARPIPQYLLLVLAAVVAAVTLKVLTGTIPLALLVATGLAVVALLPTPTYTQYFATTVPFLIVGVVELVHVLHERGLTRPPAFFVTLVAATTAAYFAFGVVDLYRAITPSKENRPEVLQQVADSIDARTQPGDIVISGFSGYLFGTHAEPWPGLENSFAPHEAAAVGPGDAKREHLATAEEVEQAIRDRRASLVVARVWHDLPPIPDFDGAARAAGYRRLDDVNGVRMYARP